ncbi:hypothetical protein ACN23B_07470 [Anabaena sp. FACHB-709]|uniref:Uncharacterized protein n=1 Tax=Anabaena cylindrica FACHB-318 TaxID=2692880 RepID=A0ABR7ZEE3_ANACY|nr:MULTISPECIES: hypothetical protein [Nostocaceae]HBW29493.1 hypothetical protein [Nostoc sp. UBA8866]MBD2170852.1 hypothetical protein [Anabaena cylindrica FACHB-318]MBD2262637.1 hypothetical protein [Anabaena sp. FACHB-709]MBD2272184.1 hypothetical protein [Nostoc sp. PCC 7120 = FACHB-418]MBD2282976.1 hypothetical protein [Anabaena cylindrica FACHB-170]
MMNSLHWIVALPQTQPSAKAAKQRRFSISLQELDIFKNRRYHKVLAKGIANTQADLIINEIRST